MASIENPVLLTELRRVITEACTNGDTVTAIAARSRVQRDCISGLRNGTYRYVPTLSRTNAILNAIGYKICLKTTIESQEPVT